VTQAASTELADLDIRMGTLMNDSVMAVRNSPVPDLSLPSPSSTPNLPPSNPTVGPESPDVNMHAVTVDEDDHRFNEMDIEKDPAALAAAAGECFLHFSLARHGCHYSHRFTFADPESSVDYDVGLPSLGASCQNGSHTPR
jgi:hypothetical protein